MHRALVVIGAVTLSAAMLAVAQVGASVQQADDQQAALDPFSAAPAQLPRTPGTVIRSEPLGIDIAASIAQQYTSSTALALQLLARNELGQTFFARNPSQDPAWLAFGSSQISAALPASMPVFIGQSTADTVVLPWPNAVLQQRWCAAGSWIDVAWVGEVSHQLTAETIGPQAVAGIADRFAGRPASRTCDMPPPVQAPAGAQ